MTVTEDLVVEIIERDPGWSQVPGYADRPPKWIYSVDGEVFYVNESEVEIHE